METKKIAVIGAGPAGIMAAIRAGELTSRVVLLEKNPVLAKKLLLSGKGRCNLTNACDLDSFIGRFSRNGQFLRNAFAVFFNKELMRFFEKRGLRLKVERQERVFPVTDKAASVLEVLKKELRKNKVAVEYNSFVRDISAVNGRIKEIVLEDKVIPAEKMILATGGVSYGFTGSTGEGIEISRRLGHRIVALMPGLVPLEIKGDYPKRLEGLTLRNIRLRFRISCAKKYFDSEIGELLFTDFGVSGPLVFSLSAKIGDWLEKTPDLCIEIDSKPALSDRQLDNRLLREFSLSPGKNIGKVLKTLLPMRLIGVFLEILGIDKYKKVSYITFIERQKIIALLKGWRLDIRGLRPIREAMVTRGGVSLKDINPATMESRIIKGLYFAGEIMDVDADTGGFNLQAAFSTGYLAGESAAR